MLDMSTTQLVFAQQDLSNSYNKTNDLVVTNNADYQNSGISVGPGGSFNNMRLAYSLPDAAGSITTDTLNIHVEQLYFKNLASATLVPKAYNYVVMDNTGNVKEGFPHYQGDLNATISTVQNDITLLKQTLGLPTNQALSTQSIIGYISIILIIILLILVIVLFIRFRQILPHALKGGKGSAAMSQVATVATNQAQQAAAASILQAANPQVMFPTFSQPIAFTGNAPPYAPSFTPSYIPNFSQPTYSTNFVPQPFVAPTN